MDNSTMGIVCPTPPQNQSKPTKSSKTVTYDDLLNSGIPLSVFGNACGVKNARCWKNDGIPKKYHSKIAKVFKEFPTPKNAENTNKNNELETEREKFLSWYNAKSHAPLKINDLAIFEQNIDFLFDYQKSIKKDCHCHENVVSDFPTVDFSKLEPFSILSALPAKVVSDLRREQKKLSSSGALSYGYELTIPYDSENYQFIYEKSAQGGFFRFKPSYSYTLIEKYALQGVAREILPSCRTSSCLRRTTSFIKSPTGGSLKGVVDIYKSLKTARFSYLGFETCANVWLCPVCAAKISERRRNEVQIAFQIHKETGKLIFFVTKTAPHTVFDKCHDLLLKYRQAEAFLKKNREYRSLLEKYGVFGAIKVYETTVGKNGWHIHIHETWFSDLTLKDIPLKSGVSYPLDSEILPLDCYDFDAFFLSVKTELFPLWRDSAVRAGFNEPSFEHGLDIQNGDFAMEYMLKFGRPPVNEWTVSQEMSKQHIKKSRKGLSLFDLLRQYLYNKSSVYSNLFVEYAQTFKGQRQLIWSRGLKDKFMINEVTDKEISEQVDSSSVFFAALSFEQVSFIVANNLHAQVLLVCEQGIDALENYLVEKMGQQGKLLTDFDLLSQKRFKTA